MFVFVTLHRHILGLIVNIVKHKYNIDLYVPTRIYYANNVHSGEQEIWKTAICMILPFFEFPARTFVL